MCLGFPVYYPRLAGDTELTQCVSSPNPDPGPEFSFAEFVGYLAK